jgi:hypothetical protein
VRWYAAVLIALGMAVFAAMLIVAEHGPARVVVVRVVSVASTGCGAFGNLTCHLVGTSTGRVFDVTDDTWLFAQPGACYSLTNPYGNEATGLHEVPCV